MIDERLETTFAGTRGRLFGSALRMGMLTVLTLGIYRFWMKTRLRRIYWSSIRPGGTPLEYVGQPLEKLLGFLIAVVILAFYLGVVNLLLMFVSFSVFRTDAPAYLASLAGVIPLWFYARYRARRYVLGRTRWRGIRFGVDAGAWGYAGRALLYWVLTLVSLGLLWPLMTFRLEKYRIDRTWFGTARLVQGGRWTMLLWPFLPVWGLSVGLAGVAVAAIYSDLALPGFDGAPMFEGDATLLGVTVSGAVVAALLWPLAALFYSVVAFRRLAATKSAGRLRVVAAPRTARVAAIYVLGYLTTAILTGILGGLLLVVTGLLVGVVAGAGATFDIASLEVFESGAAVTALGLVGYFGVFVIWGAVRHAFVTWPLWRHYATTLEVTGAGELPRVSQRERDEHTEAEGFAEALDLGAAI